jgi:hypothetical protein
MLNTTKITLIAITFILCTISNAQNKSNRYYKKNPVWIKMMNDSNTNYFEAIKAYNIFWSNKNKPEVENDILGQTKNNVSEKEIEKLSKREKKIYNLYALDIKKFEAWQRRVLPFVQEDGRILTNEEKLKLWEENKK